MYKFLKYFTFLDVQEIDAIERADAEREGRPEAQAVLAREVTRLVHGQEGLEAAQRITDALFSGSLERSLRVMCCSCARMGCRPATIVRADFPETLTQMLTDAGMANSGKQVKDALGRSAVTVNDRVLGWKTTGSGSCFAAADAVFERFYLVKLGKKKYHLFEVV